MHSRRVAIVLAALALAIVLPLTLASAQGLVAGGLTSLPPTTYGPDLIVNGSFESGSGGVPAGWTGGSGWSVDTGVAHSGGVSYRWDNAPSSDQRLALPRGVYKLTGWVKTQAVGAGSAGIRLQVDFRVGGFNEWMTTEVIQGTRDWTPFEIKNIVVASDRQAAVRLENYGGASGTAWFDDVKLERQLPQPVDVFLLYPNFRGMLFDDQSSTMRFDVTVTAPGGDLARYEVRGVLADETTGQTVAARSYPPSARFVAELDGSVMQLGRPYLATFALVDLSSDVTVYRYPAYRVSRVAGAVRHGMNVAFDEKNRVLLHGTPRFVLGVYDSGLGYSADPAYWERVLWSPTGERRMGGMAINMYLNYWLGEAPADAMVSLMSNLQAHGVMYLQTGNCFSQWPAGANMFINSSDAYVQQIGAHPGSAGYYTADECLSTLIPGVLNQYQRLRSLDPDAMTFSALLGGSDVMLWRDAVDIVSTDPYPMYGAEPAGGYNHRQVADWTALTRDAVKDARPYMTVLQFFQFTSQGRFPSLADMRNHAYMAIVEGARGLFWWSLGSGALQDTCAGWCAQKTAYMDNLKSVVNELATLEPALLADDAPGALAGNSSGAIRTKIKLVGGRGYLFAYNTTNQAISATFTWNTAPGTVTVNGEGRSVAVGGSAFTDTFGPYQAHVYLIGNAGSAGSGSGVTPGTPGTPSTPPPPGGAAPPPTAVQLFFTSPDPATTVSGGVPVNVWVANHTGASNTFNLAVDGRSIDTQTTSGAHATFVWDSTQYPDGWHTLTATVVDAANRTATASIAAAAANGVAGGGAPGGGPLSGGVVDTTIFAATLPSSRSVQVGTWATVFATIINAGAHPAAGCGIALASDIPAVLQYETTDPATNAVVGGVNVPADIPAGRSQSFVVAFRPTRPFAPTEVALIFQCANTGPAPILPGVNTVLVSASATPVPDLVALTATLDSDGIVKMPNGGVSVFAAATVNVGTSGDMWISADTGGVRLPLDVLICRTDPVQGTCLSAPASGVGFAAGAGETASFALFVRSRGAIPFDPAVRRIFVRFIDAAGVTRGSTSVAVRAD